MLKFFLAASFALAMLSMPASAQYRGDVDGNQYRYGQFDRGHIDLRRERHEYREREEMRERRLHRHRGVGSTIRGILRCEQRGDC